MKISNNKLWKNQAFINGEWLSCDSSFSVNNPSNGEELTKVSDCGRNETKLAIKAAYSALTKWKSTTAEYRAGILKRWFHLMIENKEDLGKILTLEQGKPIKEAIGEIVYGASFVEWFAEEARRTYGETIPGHQEDKRILTIRQPIGVVAAITPWNFPNAMITRKVAPALAAGCTIVVKPAEATPLSALAIAQLGIEAGIPAGVLNILPSNKAADVGEELCSNPMVRKLSFTGSTKVGKILARQCADTVKRLSLELGGNAPFIVFEDADLDAAVEGAIMSKYRNAGQTCVCANRIFVQRNVYDEFLKRLINANQSLEIGDGLKDNVDVGPLINRDAYNFVEDLIKDAKSKGGEIYQSKKGKDLHPNFFTPTVIGKAHSNMNLHSEEIFGPVAPVYIFDTEAEVIEMANDTPYGLACYFYGKDHSQIWRVAEQLEYGIVGINTGLISTAVAPFGGVKESGFGREGSKHGIAEYQQIKYICWDIS